MKIRKALKMISTHEKGPTSATAGYGSTGLSLYPVHVAHKIHKRALENSRCRRAKDGYYLDARRIWYRLLKSFPFYEKDE